jgi:hypothetical protein
MDALESRVATLEQENRGLRRGAALLLAAVGVALLLAIVIGVVVVRQASRPKVSDEVMTRGLNRFHGLASIP